MTKVIASGYFNPIHKGHIDYLKAASQLGESLIVIVNNDRQVRVKGSIPFMDEGERVKIIEALSFVDKVFLSIDEDGSVRKTIEKIVGDNNDFDFIFATGADRTPENTPEYIKLCEKLNVKMVFGAGGEKIQSSSDLLNKVKNEKHY